jgi:hypothetical protein
LPAGPHVFPEKSGPSMMMTPPTSEPERATDDRVSGFVQRDASIIKLRTTDLIRHARCIHLVWVQGMAWRLMC